MRTIRSLAFLAGASALIVSPGTTRGATVTATLMDNLGDPHSVTLTAGSFFDIFVQLDTNVDLVSGQFRLIETTAPPSGVFTLQSVSSLPSWEPPDLDPTASGTVVVPIPAGSGGSPVEVGTTADFAHLGAGQGLGSGPMLSLHLGVSALASPGVYTLNLTDPIFGDVNFQPIDANSIAMGPDYQVTIVVPDPASGILLIMGIVVLARGRRASPGEARMHITPT